MIRSHPLLKQFGAIIAALALVASAIAVEATSDPQPVLAGPQGHICDISFSIFSSPKIEADPGRTVVVEFSVSIDVQMIFTTITSINVTLPPGIAASYTPTSHIGTIADPGVRSTITIDGTITATVPQSAAPGQAWVFSPNSATVECEGPGLNQPLVDTASGSGFRIVALGEPPTPTATNTPTATATSTPTATATATNSPTATATSTPTATATATATATNTATATATSTPRPTSTSTATATTPPTSTATNTPTATATSSPTASATASSTATSAPISTGTPTATATRTPTQNASATPTGSPTPTTGTSPTPEGPPTPTATATGTASATPTDQSGQSTPATATEESLDPSQPTPTSTTEGGSASTPETSPPPNGGSGLVLQVSEARQSTEVDVQEDSDLMRVGFGLAGIIALAVGGLGLWKGYSQRA